MTVAEMVEAFSLEKVQRSDAIFDPEKLKWLNGVYIREMPLSKLTDEVIPHLENAGLEPLRHDRKWLESVIALEQERIRLFSDSPDAFDFFFKTDLSYDKSLFESKKKTLPEIANALEMVRDELSKVEPWTHTELENSCRALSSSLGWGAGDLFMPIRIAVTGKKATPPLFESMEVLGRALSLDRIDKAASLIKN
jgi:glutamyl/glutaminyl-tRNA synthetase